MKSIFKILVLGVVPILMATAVVDQGLAADKGSQLIFHSNMYHKNFISVANTSDGQAVTLLTQYYNDEMHRVLWYLRVVPGGGNVLVDPFDHLIPGTIEQDDDGEDIEGSEANVSDILGELPAMSMKDEDGKFHPGVNSGRFLIVLTAVGASTVDDGDTAADEGNSGSMLANILFPAFLAADMHAVDNIDNCGAITTDATRTAAAGNTSNVGLSRHPTDKAWDCRKDDPTTTAVNEADVTSKNVGALSVGNAEPIAFNHLTGHFTEALVGTAAGGSDQTASWGGTPVIRPAVTTVNNAAMIDTDYQTLNGIDFDATTPVTMNFYPPGDPLATGATVTPIAVTGTGRLAEKDAGGQGLDIVTTGARTDFTVPSRIESEPDDSTNRGIAGVGNKGDLDDTVDADGDGTPDNDSQQIPHGALVLPALHGGGMETTQVAILLSAADDFGDPRQTKGGDYKLIPAMTGYKVTVQDNMGDVLPDPAAEDDPVFGGTDSAESPAGVSIIVNGLSVMTNANLGKCSGTMIDGAWTLAHLTSIVPTAASGAKTFAGTDAMLDPMMNATPGLIKFVRSQLTCKRNYGDGDGTTLTGIEEADGVPTKNERTYKAGTLIREQADSSRTFVTTGQAVLKFITSDSTFGASWSLKSPTAPMADFE